VAREFNVLALIKGEERYIFIYDEVSREALVNAFRDQAADPRLSLTWFDAAVLAEKAREQAQAAQEGSASPDAPDAQDADAPIGDEKAKTAPDSRARF
jgi:hypothetical protein